MLVYILLLVILTAVGIPLCRIKHGKLIYCIFAGLALFMVAGFRKFVGTDYNSYAAMYVNSMSQNLNELAYTRVEKGFMIIDKLLANHFVDYQTLFIVVAFIISAAVMTFIYVYCDKPYLGVFCFLTFGVFFNSMNFLRQILAACIILYAFQYVQKKRFVKFMVFVLLATCFHLSAGIMAVFYFLMKIKPNWIVLGVYGVGTIGYFLFSNQVISIFTKYVYKSYQETSIEMRMGTNPFYALMFGIFFFVAFLFREDLIQRTPFNTVMLNCCFFTFLFELLGIKHAIISRFGILFIIPTVAVLIPELFSVIIAKCKERFGKDKKKYTVSAAVAVTSFAVLCMTMYGYMMSNNYNQVMPYRSVLIEE